MRWLHADFRKLRKEYGEELEELKRLKKMTEIKDPMDKFMFEISTIGTWNAVKKYARMNAEKLLYLYRLYKRGELGKRSVEVPVAFGKGEEKNITMSMEDYVRRLVGTYDWRYTKVHVRKSVRHRAILKRLEELVNHLREGGSLEFKRPVFLVAKNDYHFIAPEVLELLEEKGLEWDFLKHGEAGLLRGILVLDPETLRKKIEDVETHCGKGIKEVLKERGYGQHVNLLLKKLSKKDPAEVCRPRGAEGKRVGLRRRRSGVRIPPGP